jgi:transposase
MGTGRRKEIERHLSEAEVDAELRDEEDPEMVRRLGFIKNLYQGDTLGEAAGREGKSQPTGARWAERWNDGGVYELAPDHDGGRPSKLTARERTHLRQQLETDRPWTTQDVLHLIEEEFGVTYHPNYMYELLRSLDVDDAKPRPNRPQRPGDADETLEDRLDEALDSKDDDDDPMTDGG